MSDEQKQRKILPWSKYYKDGYENIKVQDTSVYNYFEHKAFEYRDYYALDYYGNKLKYSELLDRIDICARGFFDYGIRKGDIVTICLSNTLEGVISFFAINKLGAIVNFIHPSSSENEIKNSLNEMNSKILILLDINFIKVRNIVKDTKVSKIILVNIYGYMPYIASLREPLEVRFKIDMIKDNSVFIWWNIFMAKAKKSSTKEYAYDGEKNDSAIILHSGGTTGSPKGVVLSNGNLLAYVEICKIVQDNLNPEDTGLALMPIFHSFGIVYNILFPLCKGMKVVLRPKFEIKEYCKMIVKYKPQIISGVPTLFESLLKEWNYQKENLNFLKCAFVAGDTLKPALRDRINSFLQKHNANIRVTEGYGLSEAVAGVVQGMQSIEKEGTTGIPLPGLDVGIFSPDDEEVPYGEEGEICVSGPTVMSGYYNNIEETKVALHIHKDGKTWLHTGDIGTMDEEGFVTYTSRLKRMIVSSGYNVYPNQIERLLEAHSAVKTCSVIGVPHRYKMEVPKAYIVLEQGYTKSEFLIMELKKMCKKNLPKYSWPYQYEFIEKLPTTKVGKIDFRKLKKYSEEHKDD